MSGRDYPIRTSNGTVLQSGIPSVPIPWVNDVGPKVFLRGVVIATYVLDDPQHLFVDEVDAIPNSVYCDVLCYGKINQFIRNCLVSQALGGIHSGEIWKPRAAKATISGKTFDPEQGTNPADMDGDHVLISFIDGNFNQPVIIRSLPHPKADQGNETKEIGKRLRLRLEDGDPLFWKNHGSYFGLDKDGNYVVDTTEAYAGEDYNEGKQPDPANNADTGNYNIKLAKDSTLTVEIEGGDNIKLELKDGDAKLTLGDGAVSAMIAETFESFWNTEIKPLFDAFDLHVHNQHLYVAPLIPLPGQPIPVVGTPGDAAPKVVLPVYKPAITSSKVTFPDG